MLLIKRFVLNVSYARTCMLMYSLKKRRKKINRNAQWRDEISAPKNAGGNSNEVINSNHPIIDHEERLL